jgi:hypothetical protein
VSRWRATRPPASSNSASMTGGTPPRGPLWPTSAQPPPSPFEGTAGTTGRDGMRCGDGGTPGGLVSWLDPVPMEALYGGAPLDLATAAAVMAGGVNGVDGAWARGAAATDPEVVVTIGRMEPLATAPAAPSTTATPDDTIEDAGPGAWVSAMPAGDCPDPSIPAAVDVTAVWVLAANEDVVTGGAGGTVAAPADPPSRQESQKARPNPMKPTRTTETGDQRRRSGSRPTPTGADWENDNTPQVYHL